MTPRIFSVSLDFGTYASGFSYAALQGDAVTHWEYPGSMIPSPKNITALLYERQLGDLFGAPRAWGWDARSQYMKMKPEERSHHVYTENFKLALAPSLQEYSDTWQPHRELPANKLISDYLTELSKMATGILMKGYHSMHLDQITWVITVPTSWGEPATDIMRKAALDAGIISSLDSDALVILDESEAAAWYAINCTDIGMEEGSRFLVIDAGAASTKFAVHTCGNKDGKWVLGDGFCKDGLLIGSKLLDQGFETMLKARFGIAWDEWKHGAKTSIAYMDFMGKLWEGIKVSYSTEESQEQDQHLHQLELPQSLGKLLDKNTKKWLLEHCEDDYHFPIEADAIQSMFDLIASKIINKSHEVITMSKTDPTIIIIVGGLGSNKYLHDRIRKAFPNMIVLALAHGCAAVQQGACSAIRVLAGVFTEEERLSNNMDTEHGDGPSGGCVAGDVDRDMDMSCPSNNASMSSGAIGGGLINPSDDAAAMLGKLCIA